jgi:glycosyltransferase involved in cell wall biosynthesis
VTQRAVNGLYKGFRVAVVVPAFNEEAHVAEVVDTVPAFVDWVFVVDDLSTDGTLEAAIGPRSMVLRSWRNVGVGGSIILGHRAAQGVGADVSVVMAGDGQMNPAYLPRLLDAVVEGADYAKGNRFGDMTGMPSGRKFGNLILSLMTKAASGYYGVWDSQNGYTALRMSAFDKLDVGHMAPRYQFENDMLIHLGAVGAKVEDVPMPAEYHGEKSRIRVSQFVPQTILFLLERFAWRRLSGGRRNRGSGAGARRTRPRTNTRCSR